MPHEKCEKYVRISILVKRKPGITEAEFHSHWANIHGPLAADLLCKYGIVMYRQFHLTPEYKKLRPLIGGKEDYDAITEYLMPSYKNMEDFYNDPEYMEKIRPDEHKFVDHDSLVFCVGEEYVVIRDHKPVRGFNESPY